MTEGGVAGALDKTVASLQEGVLKLGVAAASEVAAWEELLAASENPELGAIAETLGELKAQLDPDGLDPVTVGALLTSLGDQVGRVADTGTARRVKDRLAGLGALLGKEGSALTDQATRV